MPDWGYDVEPWTMECHGCGKEHGYHVGTIECSRCGEVLNP